MAACVSVGADNVLALSPSTPIDSCTYVLVESTEYATIHGLNTLFEQYFAFDPVLMSIIVVGSLTTFATGHTLGRMMQAWRKAM